MDEFFDDYAANFIEGAVDSVVYRNKENGYTVLRLDVGEGEPVTVVGTIPGVNPGEGLRAEGEWTNHRTYGMQFKAGVARRLMPVGEKAVFDYLSSGAVQGIGLSTARKMIDLFGERALEVLENTPEELAQIRGITKKRALEMGETFRRQMCMRRLLDFLNEHSLPLQLAMPLYQRYGDLALERLLENPYVLTLVEPPVKFQVADRLALELGFTDIHPRRVEAGVLFELRHNEGNGHTFLPMGKLAAATVQLLRLEGTDEVNRAIDGLIAKGMVNLEEVAGEKACYLHELWEAETYVAKRMAAMRAEEFEAPEDLDQVIQRIEKSQGITYDDQQRRAVEMAATKQVMLLTGGPGTGKTTCLRGILALFEHMELTTALAAPTGRAAKRMGELCGAEGYTIHRLLETRFDEKTGQLCFAHNESEPLEVDAVIVDETSMVDITLMSALLAALREDCALVLVGDPDQLPSVGAGNLLSDLVRSERIPTVRLTQIHRQAALSAIVRSAHQVNKGVVPELTNDKTQDMFFLPCDDPRGALRTIAELVERRIPEKMGIPSDQVQVLCPARQKAACCTDTLNPILQARVNPDWHGEEERQFGSILFREGDRVMQIKNNYDVMWRTADGSDHGMGVFNGDIGYILQVDHQQNLITVDFDGHIVDYTPDMLPELQLAYAVTVHKAQGSEYRAVVLALVDVPDLLCIRGVLYTAITRAQELLVIVGDKATVERMTRNNRPAKRYSGLRARLVDLCPK